MTSTIALTGARIFDGEDWHEQSALIVNGSQIEAIVPAGNQAGIKTIDLAGGYLVPGFIDLQVNGGGGVLFNAEPSVASIKTICATFVQFGTTSLLPTFITDFPAKTSAAIAAGIEAAHQNVPGFLGLHLEGPHLSIARKGAHDPQLIRPMTETDLAELIAARKSLPNLLLTIAAETVTPSQIARLRAANIVISIGHSDATFATVETAIDAGATMVTHLFNAQSQLGSREPGIVGAAVDTAELSAGLIADGIHVHPTSMAIALRAKRGPGRIFLVSDAMSPSGTNATSFELGDRTVHRRDGALRLADGTLAGADLTMIDAVRYVHQKLRLPLEEALRMASLYPASAIGIAPVRGQIASGAAADFVHLAARLEVLGTWIGGKRAYHRDAA